MYESEFAERLIALREQKGVSAREMSLAIGQNQNYINRIENKKNFPSIQVFFYICEYLNITPKEFFDFEVKSPNKINKLIPQIEKLSPPQLDALSAVVAEFNKK